MDHWSRIVRISADVGGTFTDVILTRADGHISRYKLLSTPANFEDAVLKGIRNILQADSGVSGRDVSEVAHGTTVATNAVLEHQGAKTALITTKGFRDVLELRRMRAPTLYDPFFDKPEPLVERYLRFEVRERIRSNGEIIIPLEEAELWTIKEFLERENVESVAVCLLHSYAYPRHETMIGDFLRTHLPRVQVSLSCDVLRELGEYERTATTVVNAYVSPIMRKYLGALRTGMHNLEIDAPLFIMQSVGGLTTDRDAAERPVYVLESGPAAGVLAARFISRRMGADRIITLDMGGTTAKAALIEDGKLDYCPEYEVGSTLSVLGNRMVGGGGELIRAPSIDIAEVGAGGGSIARLDPAGGLHVGPRSAGAFPGPACYQQGGQEPTVTDANVVLGYIHDGALADGGVTIDAEAARQAVFDHIAKPLGMDVMKAADGIHRIANVSMMRALRAVSSERGRDPRDFDLIAFGGSGPIHAAGLANELNTRRAVIPPLPGLFSAVGLLCSSIEHHEVRSCRLSDEDLRADILDRLCEEMRAAIISQFEAERYEADRVSITSYFDMRYKGQTSEIRITMRDASKMTPQSVEELKNSFEVEHERLYGHRSAGGNPIEVVAARVSGCIDLETPEGGLRYSESAGFTRKSRKAYFGDSRGLIDTPVLTRRDIIRAQDGPFFVDEYDTTIVVLPDMRAYVDDFGNVVMERRRA